MINRQDRIRQRILRGIASLFMTVPFVIQYIVSLGDAAYFPKQNLSNTASMISPEAVSPVISPR